MTLTKDTYHTWTKAAYNYVRDQLRTNAVVGLAKMYGTKTIEVGEVTLGELVKHPSDQPAIWVTPRRDQIRRQGGVIEHRIRVEVTCYMTTVLNPFSAFADAQEKFRDFVGETYNEVLHLRDTGRTAGHWADWEPSGEIVFTFIGLEDRALLSAPVPFTLTRDIAWINEGA